MTTPTFAGNSESFTVTANSSDLAAGVYSEVITVESTAGATNITVVLPVGSCCATTVPVTTFGTVFGAPGGQNVGVAVAVDPADGDVIIAGYTTSSTLPGTANAYQPTKAAGPTGNANVFVAKFGPSGTPLLWSTFLGGNTSDIPTALAVDAAGSIYVAGTTQSSNFPLSANPYLGTYPGGLAGFAAKISADGHSLLYATYLPGTPGAAVVDSAGELYAAGSFPSSVVTAGALGFGGSIPATNGVSLIGLNSTGTGLVFGAYLGGAGQNGSAVTSLAFSPQGDLYVAGYTAESNIPTTANALQAQYSNPGGGMACCSNGFILEVDPTGAQLLYGTYVGNQNYGTAISSLAVAPDASLYFAGTTNTNMQATPEVYLTIPNKPFGGYLANLLPGDSALDSFNALPAIPSRRAVTPVELPLSWCDLSLRPFMWRSRSPKAAIVACPVCWH